MKYLSVLIACLSAAELRPADVCAFAADPAELLPTRSTHALASLRNALCVCVCNGLRKCNITVLMCHHAHQGVDSEYAQGVLEILELFCKAALGRAASMEFFFAKSHFLLQVRKFITVIVDFSNNFYFFHCHI